MPAVTRLLIGSATVRVNEGRPDRYAGPEVLGRFIPALAADVVATDNLTSLEVPQNEFMMGAADAPGASVAP
jgi:hypothetical protein